MTALASAVFLASLLGSMHCAGMCGAFLAFAVSPGASGAGPAPVRPSLIAAYNLGRLLTYAVLGALSGLVGAVVDLGAARVGLERAALALAGGVMIFFGLVAILRQAGVPIPRAPLPRPLQAAATRAHRAAASFSPLWRAMSIGLLTTLLPCGWLYAFVVTAAGTGHPLSGAAVMAVFWAGTLPMMAGLGLGIQRLAGPLRRHVPVLASVALVGVGVYTVAVRLRIPASEGAAITPADTSAAVARVRALPSQEPPCCAHDR
jgi:sulfite exporter TauE/SafE